MRCAGCQLEVAASAAFCPACGTAVKPGTVGMVAAAVVLAAADFDARTPPAPGTPVPADCVWARVPYPGPATGHLTKGPAHKRLQAVGAVAGRPFQELERLAGPPTNRRLLPNGEREYAWQGTNFWSSSKEGLWLHFDRYGVCSGVVGHEDSRSGGPSFGVGVGVVFPLGE